MASSSSQEVTLPEKVEKQLEAICSEKSQAPANVYARNLLLQAGEEEALSILSIIRNSALVRTLSGFIIHLATKTPRSPLPSSPSIGTTSSENKRKRELDCTGDVTNARRVLFGAPSVQSKKDIVLDALEKLEFRKAFLVLNYIGRSKLEDVVSAEQLLSYGRLTMREFEVQLWNDVGRDKCHEKDRVRIMDWDTQERYYYHCHIDAEGNCRFKGPILNKAATLLQKIVGDENVLIVKFMEQEKDIIETDSSMHCSALNKVAEEGVCVGRKNYKFFVFKDGGKEEKKKDSTSNPVKCYFVCMEGFANLLRKSPQCLKNMPVQEARALFMHVHKATSLSNYMARMIMVKSSMIKIRKL